MYAEVNKLLGYGANSVRASLQIDYASKLYSFDPRQRFGVTERMHVRKADHCQFHCLLSFVKR